MTFEQLNIDEDLLQAVRDLGYESPTPIQEASIEKLLKGYDLIGQSRTGTGKTAAFGIPLIELIDPDERFLQALVLCPTRELCMQVAEELRKLLKYKAGIRVVPLYGGQPIAHQITDLKKGAQIVVATPGRFIDHLRRHTLKTDQVQIVVLDEADEMLSMGFKEDIDIILGQLPVPRQTVLYSATMPEDVAAIAQEYMEDPVRIHVGQDDPLTVDSVEQAYFELRPGQKLEALLRLLLMEQPDKAIIFCNTKKRVSDLADQLKDEKLPAEGLHGDLKQVQRDLTMRRFKNREIKYLVATDVAARGLDISDVDLVVNYDLPEDEEIYVHRIGRTARAGKTGRAYSFVSERELGRLKEIVSFTGAEVQPRKIPSLQELQEAKKDRLLNEVRLILRENASGASAFSFGRSSKYSQDIRQLMEEGYQPEDIAAALLTRMMYSEGEQKDSLKGSAPTARADKDEAMVRLYLNLGKKQKIKVKDIMWAMQEKCGINANLLGRIDLMETFTYLEIPSSLASGAIKELDGFSLKGHRMHVEIAKEN